jgi:class 3 adenylate cyclase/tetratricopeptide (TPR) repeat protein
VHRKVVTVLFCDVVGSTALGESTDPEALQALLARYFERMKAIVQSHGGTVEKFIGDAVMAVFGVPTVHEDDALRACRAAVAMREALPELGIQGRIGVSTGELVTGTEERLATGDAVNVAARLQQAAEPDQVVIGEATLELVRGAVEAEPLEPLELKGKSTPVSAFLLGSVHEAPKRSHESPFVGRDRELSFVSDAWARAQADLRCELVTIVGEPGVGKSRLVSEGLGTIDAKTVSGRCLPYGEGITYWPVVEILKQLDALPSDPGAAAAIRSLLGETDRGTSAEEIAWAFRKLLEEQAPLVVVFDDLQWGEDAFLDLVEGTALLTSDVPILLVCMARPEFLSRRGEWPVALRLEPLTEQAVDELIGELPAELRRRIAAAAGGNPLFLTEMLTMAEEDAEVDVPPTLRALLAARLDQLDPADRRVLERGAVEGEIFHRGAVQALAPGEPQITPRLAALVRRELIRPDRAQLPGDDGFRFRHILIRDAAYDALPKSTRADLHERFADWLERRGADLVELDEILGYHLEQAARYRAELRQPNPALAVRAGERLAAAGQRALALDDWQAAASLLERALELTRPIRPDVPTELDLAFSISSTNADRAAEIAEAAAEQAEAAGARAQAAAARAVAMHYRTLRVTGDTDELERLCREAVELLDEVGDHASLVHAWIVLGDGIANFRGRGEEWAHAAEQALRHSRLAGQRPTRALASLGHAYVLGPTPADEALRRLDSLSAEDPGPLRLLLRARLLAALERFDEAWQIADAAKERIGVQAEWYLGELAWLAGETERAVESLRLWCDQLEQSGRLGYLSTHAPELGRMLCVLGRYDEAERLAQLGRDLGEEGDLATEMSWRQAQALVHASRGQRAQALDLAREAVAIAERTDWLDNQGDALCDLAQVLAAAGRTEEAAEALDQALDRYERKKNLAMVAQVRPKLDALRDTMPA